MVSLHVLPSFKVGILLGEQVKGGTRRHLVRGSYRRACPRFRSSGPIDLRCRDANEEVLDKSEEGQALGPRSIHS
jgi:hypothetical protein